MRFIPKDFYEKMNRGNLQKGDALVVKDGANIGKISFIRDDFPYTHSAINEHVFSVRAKKIGEQEFLFWILYYPQDQAQIRKEFHGASQGGINQQFVNAIYISITSLLFQQRIIADLREKKW